MIRNGQLLIGEPCTPYKVLRYTSTGGVMTEEILLSGRKISILDIRTQLLKKQFMRITTDQRLEFEQHIYTHFFRDHNLPSVTTEVQESTPSHQCQRHLAMWHDHATVLNKGLIMVTVHVLYDIAVFLSNKEYTVLTGRSVNVQAEVEQPMVYMLTLGSSSVEDQAALIAERVDCLTGNPHFQ